MNQGIPGLLVPTAELVPAAWREAAGRGPLRAFNPALLRHGEGFWFAYRFVAADGLRRIGACRLDGQLRVVAGSPIPLSDHIHFTNPERMPDVARRWFADPRLYRFGSRLFIYWNSGWHEPQNHQFLQELDPATLLPTGPARELVLEGHPRQKLEKNWTFFAAGGEVLGVYSVCPHRIMQVSLEGTGDVRCAWSTETAWDLQGFPPCHGGLRGGTPPQVFEDGFVSFCHSVHDGPDGYRYLASAYRFSAAAGFAPTHAPRGVIELFNPFGADRLHGRLNPAVADVVYPCGLVRDGDSWLVSHGINDEHCAITRVPDTLLATQLRPRAGAPGVDCALQAGESQR